MVTIAEGVAAATTGLNFAKDLLGLKKIYEDAELKLNIASLNEALAKAKTALSDAEKLLRAKDTEIAELKKNFEFRGTLIEMRGYKYEKGADGKPTGFAFCQRCEQEGKLHRLTKSHRPQYFTCPNCARDFKGGVTQYR
ncbi:MULTISPECIES: hypothetical protein [Bradyrhizobium]|uniref:Uncharacterized protein n=1 Tax=Bradyrhizobium yuanmingense TaxID=108015 RepID=A0A1C3UCX5_9BRAD|nr:MULTISPECIES: hypothetical protein [Bradyrhizobium]MCA1379829.1 hypothetical protein [Bradyrhizobium sp. BRP05]MCA1420157.1 hypothetical protein [Bradyrhizobium sp. BRP23]TWI20840.1 hypothetical protein IQ15_06182 [Bradyrhizobium yuanmingense]SCB13340.1 hypothetical protein GA0061099_1001963 [Bradyrhizobium yuanmingense]